MCYSQNKQRSLGKKKTTCQEPSFISSINYLQSKGKKIYLKKKKTFMFVLKITFSDVELRWDLGCLGMENLVT